MTESHRQVPCFFLAVEAIKKIAKIFQNNPKVPGKRAVTGSDVQESASVRCFG
jgi:hypothetical protein